MYPALILGLFVMATGTAPAFPEGVAAFRAGNFAGAAKALAPASTRPFPNQDYALYFLAESQFYLGDFAQAEKGFTALAKLKASRFAPQAAYRRADCWWMAGQRQRAAAAYRALPAATPDDVDPVVRRFRIAEAEWERAAEPSTPPAEKTRVAQAFLAIHVDFPGHPLGIRAGDLAKDIAPPTEKAESEPTPALRLERAETLAKHHKWREAEEELGQLPADLPAAQAAERDFTLGMAKYNSRSDYAGAAALLTAVSSRLNDERAAFAAFHGARALSRLDRDDEAIVRYRQVVREFPQSPWAIKALFRAGWLDFNRGRFREGMPGLKETLQRFPTSPLAERAAWYLTLSHYFLDELPAALEMLGTFEQKTRTQDGKLRARYFRARILQRTGQRAEALKLYASAYADNPFNYYGLLSRARLAEEKQPIPEPATPPPDPPLPVAKDADLDRAHALAEAGLDHEAGEELRRAERRIIRHLGKARALPQLLYYYARYRAYREARSLAGANRARAFGPYERLYWEALYPRAYADTVGPATAANRMSELFLYAIMRKESGYYPFAVSRADARGLLQLIPSTAEAVARSLGQAFFPDELFEPTRNIALGTGYLAGLLQRFVGQEALAAGAYNAGGAAMSRWCDQWGTRPFDEFIELITYDQAREYIKRVLGIYARYQHLYGQPLTIPLTLDPRYDKDAMK